MLVLSRKEGERIVIGEVVIEVVSIRGNKCVVAIDAPRHVRVMRQELLEAKDDEP